MNYKYGEKLPYIYGKPSPVLKNCFMKLQNRVVLERVNKLTTTSSLA